MCNICNIFFFSKEILVVECITEVWELCSQKLELPNVDIILLSSFQSKTAL